MISKKMTEALNSQINAELYSAYLYFSMSSYSSFIGMQGVANWFFVQSQEEMTHAQRIYNYVVRVGKHAILAAIDKPPAEWSSVNDMFVGSLEHEQKITGMINDLINMAIEEKDHSTQIFLEWFVTEQVEEEESVNDILSKLKLAGDGGGGLFMIDRELAARVFTPPADMAG